METQAKSTDTECRDPEMDEELADVLTSQQSAWCQNDLPGSCRCFHGRTEKRRKEETRMSKMSELSLAITELKHCGDVSTHTVFKEYL